MMKKIMLLPLILAPACGFAAGEKVQAKPSAYNTQQINIYVKGSINATLVVQYLSKTGVSGRMLSL